MLVFLLLPLHLLSILKITMLKLQTIAAFWMKIAGRNGSRQTSTAKRTTHPAGPMPIQTLNAALVILHAGTANTCNSPVQSLTMIAWQIFSLKVLHVISVMIAGINDSRNDRFMHLFFKNFITLKKLIKQYYKHYADETSITLIGINKIGFLQWLDRIISWRTTCWVYC